MPKIITNSDRPFELFTDEELFGLVDAMSKVHPMDPDPSKTGVFRDHNCYVCDNGNKPCIKGNPRDCDTLRARND